MLLTSLLTSFSKLCMYICRFLSQVLRYACEVPSQVKYAKSTVMGGLPTGQRTIHPLCFLVLHPYSSSSLTQVGYGPGRCFTQPPFSSKRPESAGLKAEFSSSVHPPSSEEASSFSTLSPNFKASTAVWVWADGRRLQVGRRAS